MINVDLTCQTQRWGEDAPWLAIVSQCACDVLAHLGMADITAELSVLLTGDDQISAINAQWRGKDQPTNVLSFPTVQLTPGDRPLPLLGDLVFAHETIAREADLAAKPFNDHFTHLVVHGLLHLLGYDHAVDNEAETMENLEKAILAAKGIDDPYAPMAS